jgi:hypothetical protein
MATRREVRGAPSILEEDQTSFEDDQPRHGKHYTGGRKVIELGHVGAGTPDADANNERNGERSGAGRDEATSSGRSRSP